MLLIIKVDNTAVIEMELVIKNFKIMTYTGYFSQFNLVSLEENDITIAILFE